VDRLSAIEQSIFAEAEVADLFRELATTFYSLSAVQDFWQRLARSEAGHVLMLEFEKWRMAREESAGLVKYSDPALLRQMKKFDDLRGSLVHPPEFKQALAVALKAEEFCQRCHDERIMLEEVGVTDSMLQAMVDAEAERLAVINELIAAADPVAALATIDLGRLGDFFPEG
jgi:hypothetical protein